MALRTRCLECEFSTERRQDYQAIGVPVHKASEEDAANSDSETGMAYNKRATITCVIGLGMISIYVLSSP